MCVCVLARAVFGCCYFLFKYFPHSKADLTCGLLFELTYFFSSSALLTFFTKWSERIKDQTPRTTIKEIEKTDFDSLLTVKINSQKTHKRTTTIKTKWRKNVPSEILFPHLKYLRLNFSLLALRPEPSDTQCPFFALFGSVTKRFFGARANVLWYQFCSRFISSN